MQHVVYDWVIVSSVSLLLAAWAAVLLLFWRATRRGWGPQANLARHLVLALGGALVLYTLYWAVALASRTNFLSSEVWELLTRDDVLVLFHAEMVVIILSALLLPDRKHISDMNPAGLRRQGLQELSEVSHAIVSAVDLDQILHRTLVGAVLAVPAADIGLLYLLESDGSTLTARVSYGLEPTGERLAWVQNGEWLAHTTIQDGKARLLGPRHGEELGSPESHAWPAAEAARVSRARGAIGVPLILGQRPAGALVLFALQPAAGFQRDDLLLLEPLANQAAIAIENVRLYREIHGQAQTLALQARDLEQKVGLLSALQAASRALTQHLDLGSVLDEILRFVTRVCHADCAAVILEGPDGVWRPQRAVGIAGAQADGATVERRDPVIQRLLAHQPLRVGNTDTSGPLYRAVFSRWLTDAGVRAYMMVPLQSRGRVVGAVGVFDRSPRAYQDEELEVLAAFADQASIAIRNARLYELEAARVRALRETDELKSTLLSSVSHELRTPLHHIKGFASTLLRTDVEWNRETERDFLQSINRESDRLARLVENLLEMSRIEAGHSEQFQREWWTIADIVNLAVARFPSLDEHHRIVVSVPLDLQPVHVDGNAIERVLVNLIENAIKYSPPGTEVCVQAEGNDRQVVVSVADEGPGVPADEVEAIFQKFHRGSNASPMTPGFGLGLAICRSLVAAHDGSIGVEPGPLGGACFRISLPVATETEHERTQAPSATAVASTG